MSTTTAPTTTVVTSRSGVLAHVRAIWRYRELLVGMVRSELKVKYKNSILGFFWSMLNPALYLVVFYVVFQLILGSGIPMFAIFLLSGLLVWNLFSVGLAGATGSLVGSAGIVKKVFLPREIIVLAPVGAALVHFFLQSVVLLGALLIFRQPVGWGYLPLIPFALVTLLVFTAGLGLLLAAANVYLRDTQHLLELALLAWFWMTPIVYPFRLIGDKGGWASYVYKLNPLMWIVLTFQRAIYNRAEPNGVAVLPTDVGFWYYGSRLGVILIASVFMLLVGMKVFARVEGNFAEEL